MISFSNTAFAQDVPEHGIFILNSLLFLIGGFLVMFMACGFCMLEAGLGEGKKYYNPINKKYSPFFNNSNCLLHNWL